MLRPAPRIATAALAAASLLATAAAAEAPASAPWVAPAVTYDGTALANLHGGAQRGGVYVGNLHLKANLNGEPLGLAGTSAFVDLLDIHGGRPSRRVGDAQGTSNI